MVTCFMQLHFIHGHHIFSSDMFKIIICLLYNFDISIKYDSSNRPNSKNANLDIYFLRVIAKFV